MLFNRVAELTVGAANEKSVIIRDLRFSFSITKDNDKSANNLSLKIYNMNQETRSIVERVNNSVILKAGYEHDIGAVTIFTGSVISAWTEKIENNIITYLSVSDGILPLRDTKISLSYAPGISAITVLKDVAASFNIPIKPYPKKMVDKTYTNGYSFVGKADTAMRDICEYLGLTWSIQNHELQILDKKSPIGEELVVLTPDNGLIGIPSRIVDATRNKQKGETSPSTGLLLSESRMKNDKFQTEGYRVKCLLQPRLYPGCYVGLESDMLQLNPNRNSTDSQTRPRAYFRAETVTHAGDTTEGNWLTECELKPLE